MATAQVAFADPMKGNAPVLGRAPRTEVITTSGTSDAGGILAQANDIVSITVIGGNVWVAIGPDPVASAGSGYLIPDGGTKEIATVPGDRVAAVNA